jgi:hypothetical protein
MYKEVITNKNTWNATLFLISLSLLTINPSDKSTHNLFLILVTIMILIDFLKVDLRGLLHELVHFFSA